MQTFLGLSQDKINSQVKSGQCSGDGSMKGRKKLARINRKLRRVREEINRLMHEEARLLRIKKQLEAKVA